MTVYVENEGGRKEDLQSCKERKRKKERKKEKERKRRILPWATKAAGIIFFS